jgi:hypothetical protein
MRGQGRDGIDELTRAVWDAVQARRLDLDDAERLLGRLMLAAQIRLSDGLDPALRAELVDAGVPAAAIEAAWHAARAPR